MSPDVLIRVFRGACAAVVFCCALGACSPAPGNVPADDAPAAAETPAKVADTPAVVEDPPAAADAPVRLVSQTDALALTTSDAAVLFLDVRSTGEFASGHVPGALNIPVGELAGRLAELEASRDAEIIVYCEMGGRARKAENMLKEAGYGKLGHLEGDMGAWRSAGLATE